MAQSLLFQAYGAGSGNPFTAPSWHWDNGLNGAFHLAHNTRTAVKDQLKIQILGSAPLRFLAAEEILEQVQKLIIHY